MKKNFKLLLLTLIMGGGFFASEAMALEQKDGVYQIGTAQDWADFCSTHNNGTNQNLNAVLTADITVSGNTMVGINSIGKPYRGTFDGQGHKLTINYVLNEERVAPFRRINGATIKNLIVEGTITTTSKLAAGIVGGIWQSGSTVINCVSNVTINDTNSGDATHGGICGSFEDVNGWNTIENCAFVGTINASNRKGCGGIVGWTNDQYIDDNKQNNNIIRNCYVLAENYKVYKGNDSDNDIICRNTANVENCYYVGSIDGLKNDKDATAKNIEELLSTLGDGWYQNFSYTNYPVPFVDAQYTTQTDGYFQIENGSQLNWFSYYVNKTFNGANAKLTHDIDMTGVTGWTPIGQKEHEFKGHFDGQGHRINHLTTSAGYNNQALFGQAIGGAIIEKVIIGASCTIQGVDYTAGILGHVYGDGVIVRNCGNEANINGTGANSAGIVGCSEKKVYISNCYNTGTITGDRESAGICAWMGDAASTITNCYSIGEVKATGNNQGGSNRLLWRKDEVQGTNVYCIFDGQGTKITDKQISNGDLCFQLNNNNETIWHQAIGIDNHPYPFNRGDNSTVYKYGENIYSNINGDNKYSDGYFQISNASDLVLFAGMINGGNGSANGKLTADIDMTDKSWTPIGNNDHRYAGTFDGQFHMINNLTVDLNQENVGIFGVVQSCTIQNLISGPNNSFKGTKGVGGIIGKGDSGGTNGITLTCVGNESAVTATSQDAGGLIGYVVDQTQNVTITNCYNTGNVKAGSDNTNYEAAAIAGWLGRKTVSIKGFWNTGSITGSESSNALWRNGDGSVTKERIYNLHNTDNGATKFTQDQLSNGELCYLLNGSSSENPVWYQTIGTDVQPAPFSNGHQVVHNTGNIFTNDLEDAEFYTIANAADFTSFATFVSNGYTTAKGKLTADIDFDGTNNFPGIGGSKTTDSDPNPICFAGVLDGDFHKIMNLTVDKTELEAVGLVNSATAGATIKNLTIASTCEFKGRKAVGAFVGGTYNGSGIVTFLNCGNEGKVTSLGVNAGGILGCNFNGDIAIHLTNCYNNGTVKGGESAGISGWLGNSPVLRNCYNMGEVQGTDYFARMNNDGASLTNCFDSKSTWDALSSTKDGKNVFDVATVFAAFRNDTDGSVWRMELSSTPHPVLYGDNNFYENRTNSYVPNESGDVTLYRTIKAGVWNTFCAPFAVSTSQFTKVVELDVSKTDNEVLHFITASTIEAGKAYLVKTDNAISEINASNVTVSPTITPSTAGGYAFTGVYSPTSLPQDAYVFTTKKENGQDTGKDVIIKVNAGTNMNGFRAYLKATNSNARATSFVIDEDGTTGIITATGDVIENGKTYNLGGQRVNEPQRGLYIVNGKKYIK